MVTAAPYTILDVAAGVGMLSSGLKLGLELLGARGLVVGGIERDASAAAAFLAWLADSQGCCPPVWDDARTFVGRRDRRLESVDVVCAGYPCQPFSAAGKRLGSKDTRHLWPAVRRIVARVQPQLVFFGNVDGHVTMGLWKVLRDCERLGYRVTAGVFSAEEVGAPHLRKRVFILGHRTSSEQWHGALPGVDGQGMSHRGPSGVVGDSEHGSAGSGHESSEPMRRGRQRAGRRSSELANPQRTPRGTQQQHDAREREDSGPNNQSVHGRGCTQLAYEPSQRRAGYSQQHLFDESVEARRRDIERCDAQLADDDDARLEGGRFAAGMPCGVGSLDGCCGAIPIFPAHRTDYGRWAQLVALGLDPTLMPAIESGLSVVADGLAPPADILRCGGNGVVPLTAAWAFINLAACLFVDESQCGPPPGSNRGGR